MKPYPAYKDSGIEWIGEIPEHWKMKRLKHLVHLVNEKTEDVSRYELKIALENIEGFTGKLLHTSGVFEGIGNRFHKGDLLFNKLRPYLCKAVIAPEEGVCVGELLTLRAKNDISINLLLYTLLSSEFISIIDGSTYGAKMPRASWDFIGNLLIPVTNKSEQESLVIFLKDKTTQIDNLIEKKQKQIELLQEERTAIINQAVTKGLNPDVPMKDSGIEWLGEVPEHWGIKKLKYLADQSREKKETYGSLKVGLENIESWTGRLINLELANVFESEGIVFNQEDILFGKLRPYLAKVHKAQEAGICVSEILVLRPNNLVTSDFLYYRCLSEDFIKEVNSSTYGSKMPRANWDFIGNLSIPFPTISEQNSITNLIGSSIDKSNRLIEVIQQQIILLQEYRTALISNAVTGKIDVRT